MAAEPAAPVDTRPFDLAPDADAAALCLHGLTGTPYEVRPLGEALAEAGLRARGPVLPGHDGSPEELARYAHTDWLAAVRAELHALRERHRRVCAVGLSLGGLLTLALAAEERVDAAVVIGTPLRLSRTLRMVVPLLRFVTPLVPKRGGSDIRDEAARLRHPSQDVMPLRSVRELMLLQQRVRASLERVRAPLLVAHGAHDRTANPADAEEILARVGSSRRERLLLRESGHVVPVDRDGPALARAVVAFLQRHV